jgi:hypothetical protein
MNKARFSIASTHCCNKKSASKKPGVAIIRLPIVGQGFHISNSQRTCRKTIEMMKTIVQGDKNLIKLRPILNPKPWALMGSTSCSPAGELKTMIDVKIVMTGFMERQRIY